MKEKYKGDTTSKTIKTQSLFESVVATQVQMRVSAGVPGWGVSVRVISTSDILTLVISPSPVSPSITFFVSPPNISMYASQISKTQNMF